MANNALGFSFAPTFDNAEQARGQMTNAAPQGSIQTLNFALPKVNNAPSPLVSDSRRSATFGGAVLESVLKTVLGPEAAAQFGGFAASPEPSMDAAPAGFAPQDIGAEFLRLFSGGAPLKSKPDPNVRYDIDPDAKGPVNDIIEPSGPRPVVTPYEPPSYRVHIDPTSGYSPIDYQRTQEY